MVTKLKSCLMLSFNWPLLQDFQVDAMEKFIAEASIPVVTVFDNDPNNNEYVNKFFDGTNSKVLDSASCNAAF